MSAAPLEAEEPLCPPRATTALEDTAFAPSDTVVVARLLRVQEIRSPGGGRGRQLVRARVELVLKGNVKVDDEISIMVIGQRPTLNPEQPSVPYFRADKLDRYVLFLDRERGQYAFRLRTLFEGKGKLGAEKIAVSQAVGRLAAIPGEDEKARRTLAALFAMTKGTGKWTKGFAAREMNYLAAVRPDVFDTKTKARLRRLPTVVLTPEQRHWFKLLFKTLSIAGAMPALPDAKDTESVEQDPWRATFLSAADEQQQQTMLTRLLRGDAAALERHGAWAWSEMEPEMRRWYARAAGQERVPAEAARLRRRYSSEEDEAVRAAIVRTLGLAGGPTELQWLMARAQNLKLRRDVLLAIARIHDTRGTAFLRSELARAKEAKRTADVEWLTYLLGDTFAEAETRAGRR